MHADMTWQFDWRGPRLQNLRLLVCHRCLDKPFEHWRPIIVPPDPLPIRNPRPDLYSPLMPYIITDTNGRELEDTTSASIPGHSGNYSPIWATNEPSPPSPPAPNNFDDYGYTTAQAIDQYTITAPDGGPVILIPE